MSLSFEVSGDPVPKGRPRFSKQGRAYTPTKTRQYENWVAIKAQLSRGDEPPMEGPLALTIIVRVRRPKSRAKRFHYPDKRPDLDNYVKAVMDGLDKASVWLDDAQVVALTARKVYADVGGISVSIGSVEG